MKDEKLLIEACKTDGFYGLIGDVEVKAWGGSCGNNCNNTIGNNCGSNCGNPFGFNCGTYC